MSLVRSWFSPFSCTDEGASFSLTPHHHVLPPLYHSHLLKSETAVRTRGWQAHFGRVARLAFSPDERTLVTEGWGDTAVKLWDVSNGILRWVGRQTGGFNAVAFPPDGELIATVAGDTLVQL